MAQQAARERGDGALHRVWVGLQLGALSGDSDALLAELLRGAVR